jgi:hypothetical protein
LSDKEIIWNILDQCENLVEINTEMAWFGLSYGEIFERLSQIQIDQLRILTGITSDDYLTISQRCRNLTAIHSIGTYEYNLSDFSHLIEMLENNPNLILLTIPNYLPAKVYFEIILAAPKLTLLKTQFNSLLSVSEICSTLQGLNKYVLKYSEYRSDYRYCFETIYEITKLTQMFTITFGPTLYFNELQKFTLQNTIKTFHTIEFHDFKIINYVHIYDYYLQYNTNIKTVVLTNCFPQDCGIDLKLLCRQFGCGIEVIVNGVVLVVDA